MFSEAEGHAISSLKDDIHENTFGGEKVRCFMLGETQFDEEWDHVIVTDGSQIRSSQVRNRYSLCDSEKRITIDLKDLFLDQLTTINYIAFIQDNDSSPDFGESAFENIVLFEESLSGIEQQLVSAMVRNKRGNKFVLIHSH